MFRLLSRLLLSYATYLEDMGVTMVNRIMHTYSHGDLTMVDGGP